MWFKRQQIIIYPLSIMQYSVILLLCSQVPWHASIKSLFGLIYILLMSYILGKRHFKYHTVWLATFCGFLILAGYFTIIGTFLFYIDLLSPIILKILVLLSPFLALSKEEVIIYPKRVMSRFSSILNLDSLLIIISVVSSCIVLSMLFLNATTDSSRAVWPLLPWSIFILFFIALASLIVSIIRGYHVSWLVYIPLLIATYGAATILYPLGFGFDPFIHQATERILITTGSITPKPLYYTGYYVLVASMQSLLGVSHIIIDTWLLLILLSVGLPILMFSIFRYCFIERKYAIAVPLLLTVFPYGDLLQSTPQSLSFLWSLFIILATILYIKTTTIQYAFLIILALTASAFHPLSGVVLFLFVIAAKIIKDRMISASKIDFFLIVIAVVPTFLLILLFFIATRYIPDFSMRLHTPDISWLWSFMPKWYRYSSFDDLRYSLASCLGLFQLCLAGAGAIYLKRRNDHTFIKVFGFGWLMTMIAFCTFISCVDFGFTNLSERSLFALRLLSLSTFFLLPFMAFGWYSFLSKIKKSSLPIGVGALILIASISSISWYMMYPRFDTYVQSKGFTASQDDYDSVRWIHDDAQNAPYVVLANQTTSAVAVKIFGFSHYYNNIFYYPLPTNGWLYQQFLELMKPSADIERIINDVRKKTGVRSIYVVVPDYWDQSTILQEKLSTSGSTTMRSGHGSITLFR